MNVCLFCCSLYLVCVLIVVIMGRWSEFSVCQVVRLYSIVEIVVMSVRWPAVVFVWHSVSSTL